MLDYMIRRYNYISLLCIIYISFFYGKTLQHYRKILANAYKIRKLMIKWYAPVQSYDTDPFLRLSIWVTWNAEDAIDDVELLFTDGSVENLGSLPAQCDQPITMRLHAQLPMNTVCNIRFDISHFRYSRKNSYHA